MVPPPFSHSIFQRPKKRPLLTDVLTGRFQINNSLKMRVASMRDLSTAYRYVIRERGVESWCRSPLLPGRRLSTTNRAHQALFFHDKHEGVAVLVSTLAVSRRSWADVRPRVALVVLVVVPGSAERNRYITTTILARHLGYTARADGITI